MILQVTHWQNPSGYWSVGSTQDLAHYTGTYWMLARGLRMRPVDFLTWLFKEFKPDRIFSNLDYKNEADGVSYPAVFYRWKNESQAIKFEKAVNKLLKEALVDFSLND